MKKIIILISVVIFLVLLAATFYYVAPVLSTSNETNVTFSSIKEVKNTSGRTNILLVGVDTRDSKYLNTGTLTDTMIIISLDKNNKKVKMLSLPRDLWVTYDQGSSKINEVYTRKDLSTLKDVVEETLGIDIHYTAKVDFAASVKLVDLIGGVDIENPAAFTDYYYPKFGWENETCGLDVEALQEEKAELGEVVDEYDFPCRFEAVTFEQGLIHLNGENTIKFARSRHSLDSNQGTDFARAKRQQLIIVGVKDALLSSKNFTDIGKIKGLYSTMNDLIETNFTINDLLLALKDFPDYNTYEFQSAVLSDTGLFEEGGVLVRGDPELYGGLYVLVPSSPDSIVSFANSYFFADR
jgi:LCP family protein required for cell wall assembly